MSSQTEQIKAKLSIAEVIGSYLKLEKAGSNFKARCPFHNEKTPSFIVSPARDTYHCFGCNRGGDIFSFVQEIEGLDFLGALEVLARQAGVELKPIDLKQKTEQEKLHTILEEAAKFFHTNLLKNSEAKDYLKTRGVSEETVRRFKLGFAPAEWAALYSYLSQRGYHDDDIEKTGLIIKSSQSVRHAGGRYYDRFRSRIMFPLFDGSGRPVGFSGRIMVGAGATSILGAAERQEAKYINSPQTPLYDKSRILYGYDKAKKSMREKDFCVLVEGQMDLIMSHQAGLENTVAVSGTALTSYHLGLIKRLTDNLIMAFDGDTAGILAASRGINLALSLGMEVKIALLPDELDPADLVAQDRNSWLDAVDKATNVIDFYLAALGRKNYDKRTLSKKISSEVLPYVARLPNIIDQAHFVSKIASFAGVSEEPVWDELKKIHLAVVDLPADFSSNLPASPSEQAVSLSRSDTLERKLFGLFFWLSDSAQSLVEQLASNLQDILGADNFIKRQAFYKPDKNKLSLEAEVYYEGAKNLGQEIQDLTNNFHEEILKTKLEVLLKKVRELEQSKTSGEELATCLEECRKVGRQLNELKNTTKF